ncbi:hypothetical protein QBC47DRAFT_204291 [Echria macrotheca]|uniref:protein-histidine N-methyltransferase n=1 Tax=Echria macrotheca TaxID=438768 RepID=A0AAJ0BBF1_9PEZI|nr:hypothetical protein QBC47DRAFT_204291 [Echria macrotheca]
MASAFSFSFAGDDIDDDGQLDVAPVVSPTSNAETSTSAAAATANAFPVQGKPLLPPVRHELDHLMSRLPSKIAYSTLSIGLDDGHTISIPRRELWDVRVQLMAEEEDPSDAAPGLGQHDVKTGIYEGGFKSWESSVDLVKVLASQNIGLNLDAGPFVSIELGCGTALPSLAIFRWALDGRTFGKKLPLSLVLADYNPTVLYLVTLPNFLLTWALQQRGELVVLDDAFTSDGELELSAEVLDAFKESLSANQISLSFLSGGWSPEFVEQLYTSVTRQDAANTLVMGAETIYSPFALESFVATLHSILDRERQQRPNGDAYAIIAAKRLYFGVGGSLDDFVDKMKSLGATVETLREEAEGVRRGVVRCSFS